MWECGKRICAIYLLVSCKKKGESLTGGVSLAILEMLFHIFIQKSWGCNAWESGTFHQTIDDSIANNVSTTFC